MRFFNLLNELLETLSGHGLWSLQWETSSTGPDHLREAAQCTGNAKENSVVVHLSHTVMLRIKYL